MGHDPLRVGTAARARGLTPNIHLTCVNGDRQALRKTLEDLHALGIENVFALTGDFPKAQAGAGPAEAVFDLDSVQLVRLIAEMRAGGHALSRRRRRLAVQVRRGGLHVPVLEAREEDRRRRRPRDHAGRLGRGEVRRAQALSGRARPRHAGARQRVRARAESRRADGDGPAARLLGLARAARDGARRKPRRRTAGCARGWSGRPARSRCSAASAMPARTSAARTMPASRVDHPARRRSWRRGGKRWPRSSHFGDPDGILSVRPAPHAAPAAHAPAVGRARSCRGSST